jgi:hypothetical protein
VDRDHQPNGGLTALVYSQALRTSALSRVNALRNVDSFAAPCWHAYPSPPLLQQELAADPLRCREHMKSASGEHMKSARCAAPLGRFPAAARALRAPGKALGHRLARVVPVRIFVAGASGVIGIRLVPLLVADGHVVAGLTRSPAKAGHLREAGAEPVVCDVFDAVRLADAVAGFAPDLVIHELTDLPDRVADIAAFGGRNDRIRTEGTRNLLAAAEAARAQRVIAQSISWELPTPGRRAATAELERSVLQAGGVVVRYGQLYGPGTYHEGAPPDPPRIHVDDAAKQTMSALSAPAGLTIVVDDRSTRPESAA